MITIEKVVKWVNSLAVRIPKVIAGQCAVQEVSAIKLKVKSENIVS